VLRHSPILWHKHCVINHQNRLGMGNIEGGNGLKKMQICIFLDDHIITDTLQEFLSDLGHEVICFHIGYDFLEEMEGCALKGDLIITELTPDGKIDNKVICEIHQRHSNAPVILVTDTGSILSPEMAISCGVHAYLRKPISFAELELLLARLADKSSEMKTKIDQEHLLINGTNSLRLK